jgi:hypothetical protein
MEESSHILMHNMVMLKFIEAIIIFLQLWPTPEKELTMDLVTVTLKTDYGRCNYVDWFLMVE